MQHRINRLIPGACICSSLTAFVLLTAYPFRDVALKWLRSVTLSPVGPWVDGPYWTLPIELSFYVFVFLNLLYRRGVLLPWATVVLGLVSTAACFAELLRPAAVPSGLQRFLDASTFPPSACSLLLHGCFFAVGVFLYLSLVQRLTVFRCIALFGFTAGCVAEVIWHDRVASAVTSMPPEPALPLWLWFGAISLLVTAVLLNGKLHSRIGRRGSRVTRQIGVATYPLYLLHSKLGQVAIGGLHRKVGYGPALLFAAILMTGLAVLVSMYLEPLIRRPLQRIWKVH